jgi:hypothetical protein
MLMKNRAVHTSVGYEPLAGPIIMPDTKQRMNNG